MNYVPFNKDSLSLALKKAQIPQKCSEKILEQFEINDIHHILPILEKQRMQSLIKFHDSKKQLDMLDYIINQLKKQ